MIQSDAAVILGGLQLQHISNPVTASHRLGHGNDQACHFDQLHEDLGHIVIQCHHLALGQNTGIHLQRTDPDQQHHRHIDHHIGHRIHQSGDPSGS